jgi:hypothetical protein
MVKNMLIKAVPPTPTTAKGEPQTLKKTSRVNPKYLQE